MAVEKRLYTIEAFEAYIALPHNRDRRFELIDGEIIEKTVPTQEHGVIAANLVAALVPFVRQHRLGRVGAEIRSHSPGDAHNLRQPDISFHAGSTEPLVRQGPVPRMPDLAVEIKDNLRELRAKAEFYLNTGVQLVWLDYPDKQLVEVYTPDDEYILTAADTLSGGAVLPGFALPIRDIFAD